MVPKYLLDTGIFLGTKFYSAMIFFVELKICHDNAVAEKINSKCLMKENSMTDKSGKSIDFFAIKVLLYSFL